MKRQEAEWLIAEIIDDNTHKTKAELSAIILARLLQAGMLPPPYFSTTDVELMKTDPDLWMENVYFGYEGIRKWEDDV